MDNIDRMREEKTAKYLNELGDITEVSQMVVDFNEHKIQVSEIVFRVLHWSASLEVDAGLGGHHHDGGSRALFRELQCWVEGLKNSIPAGKHFQNIAKQIVQEADPAEYEVYKRLHAKYGG